MEINIIVIFLGLLIFCAHFFNIIFSKTKIPNALWLLVIGMIIGPIAGLVNENHFGAIGPVFTNLTLIIILFESGVNLKIKELGAAISSATLLTVVNFIIGSAVATAIAFYLTPLDNIVSAAFFGVIVGGTSSAVVIPIVRQLKMNPKGETILTLESAFSDVLCLVIGLALLSALSKGIFDFKQISIVVLKSFFIAALIGVGAGLAWSIFLDKVRRMQNYAFTNLAIVFVVAGFTDLIGLNGGIATLAFGVTLGNAYLFENTSLRDIFPSKELLQSEKSFFGEIAFILQTYFFVYVGVSIKFGNPLVFLLGMVIVAIVIILRPFAIRLFVREKMTFKDLAIMGVLSPKGLVPAILASIPVQMGLEGGHIIQDLAYSVVVFSILASSILVIVLSRDQFTFGFLKKVLFGGSIEYKQSKEEQEMQQDPPADTSVELEINPSVPDNDGESSNDKLPNDESPNGEISNDEPANGDIISS